jgi:P4 family phage/plasmid primase-like protien
MADVLPHPHHDKGAVIPLRLEDLADRPIHVAWKEVMKKGKPTKVPIDPRRGGFAKVPSEPSTWGSRWAAEKRFSALKLNGAAGGTGIVLDEVGNGLRLAGLDCDRCRKNGELAPWATEVLKRFKSYSEVSPSGEGVKVFFLATAADIEVLRDKHLDGKLGHSFTAGEHFGITLDTGRFYTVTGQALDGFGELRLVPMADIKWLLDDAGPRFLEEHGKALPKKGEGKKTGVRDNSGSGYGFRFFLRLIKKGKTREYAFAAIEKDQARAGAWARRSNERELERAWEEAEKFALAGLQDAVALAYAAKYARTLRYVAVWNRWLQWDGICWRFETTLVPWDLARELCRDYATVDNFTVNAIVSLARADRRLAATEDQWDADLYLLGTPKGTVDLRSGKLEPVADPDDYITKTTAVAPDPNCPTPLWTAFLEDITGKDKKLQNYLQRMSGYCLTGDTREEAMFFSYGTGANGKGTFWSTVAGIMKDYHTAATMGMFTATKQDRHPTDMASLRGARLVTATETEEGRFWDEAKIKYLTGGDPISARFMRQDPFDFIPQFKLGISGNHRPKIKTVDEAIRRRMNLLPFLVTIPKEERDKHLKRKLRKEWPGILHWMVEGCLAWQREGLNPPAAVVEATEEYLKSEDTLGRWLEECCTVGKAEWASSAELWSSWKSWTVRGGEWTGSRKAFVEKLEECGRGFVSAKNKGERGYRGLSVRPPHRPRIRLVASRG